MNWVRTRRNNRVKRLRWKPKSRFGNVFFTSFTIFFVMVLWYVITRWTNLPEFLLPSPEKVWDRFIISLETGVLTKHTLSTFSEVMGGLLIGISIAAMLGYFLAKSHPIERLLAPFIVASQSIPIVAIAPLLIIWFGSGRLSKVLISALIVFFPVLVNTTGSIWRFKDWGNTFRYRGCRR
jgi:NitT/TauT family transport system permease protein